MGIKNWGKNYGQLLKNNKIVKIGEKWMDARLKNAINGEKNRLKKDFVMSTAKNCHSNAIKYIFVNLFNIGEINLCWMTHKNA